MISKSRLLIFGKQSGRTNIISKNFGKIFRYAFRRTYFFRKNFEKKAYILCVHIEGRVEGVGKEGVKVKGVKIEAYKYKYE